MNRDSTIRQESAAHGIECPICLDSGFLRFDVPLDDPKFGQIRPCSCMEQRLGARRREQLLNESNLGTLSDCTFDTFNTHSPVLRLVLDQARAYARRSAQGWMIFKGPFGCGKTHLAAIGNTLLEWGKPVLFAFVPDLLDELQAMSADERFGDQDGYLRKIQSAQFLILDALRAEQQSLWGAEKILQILWHRSERMLPTVITLNNPLSAQPPHIRSLLADKLLCVHLRIDGPDFCQLPPVLRLRRPLA